MITNLESDKVIEFALGESPYENLINRDNIKIQFSTKNIETKLAYDGINYLMTKDNFNTLIDIYTSDFCNKNSLNAINVMQFDLDISSGIIEDFKNIHIIEGVPNEQNPDPTPGCGPVSAINIIKYWHKNGYNDLVKSGDTKQILYDQLYREMECFTIGDQVATCPGLYLDGIVKYFDNNGNYTVDIELKYNTDNNSDLYSKLVSEVNADRPGTILYGLGTDYGIHYVTFVGYCRDFMDENYYIIHDLWNTNDVYKNWNNDIEDKSIIGSIYYIRPQ